MIYLRSMLCLINVLASGWTDYDVSLSKKCHLLRTNAYTVMIYTENEDVLIPPKITGLNKKGDLIFGLCENSKNADIPSVAGYFLLDTDTFITKVGLTKAEWLEELKKYGISKEPSLKKPTRFWNVFAWAKRLFYGAILICCFCIILKKYAEKKLKKT